VDYVLGGSVRRDADRLRIAVQLIRVADQTHIWAESYDRDLRDIFLLQSEVAEAVAPWIEIRITPQEQSRLTTARPVHPGAHEDYLRGRFYWNQRTAEGLLKGREYFERALEKDPLYARAYSGLADAYTNMTFYGVLSAHEAMPRAKAAAQKALDLDDTLGEAHASLGMAVFYYDWDWDRAEYELERAIELNPGYSTARYWYAVFLADLGRGEESIRAMHRALEVDPLSLRTRCDVGWTYFFARRYDEAVEQFKKALAIDPDFPMAHHILGETYTEMGLYEEGIEELSRALALSPRAAHFKAMIGYAHARAGNVEEARRILDELKARPEPRRIALELATLHGVLGERDEAFEWLEMAFEDRRSRIVRLGVEPWWASLYDDPRFVDLLRRINLDDRASEIG
jgi:tetratricopeptide (TPR) repeat protein